jgi:hypothetical protein
MKRSQIFLSKVKKKSGVYLITSKDFYEPAKNDVDKKILVKIGLAKDLDHRLNSYLLYWPTGVHIFDIFYTTKASARSMERSIHEYLNNKAKYIVSMHSHTEEWFCVTTAELKKVIKLVTSNAETRFVDDYITTRGRKTVNLKGQKVFPYKRHEKVNLLLISNLSKKSDRIKPMSKSLKQLLDPPKSPIRTEEKKQKKTFHYTGGGRRLDMSA